MRMQFRERGHYNPSYSAELFATPFDSTERAWFWFMQASAAKAEGAKITAGEALVPRPCEPLDILRIVDRLYKQRRLILDHIRVLAHYGRRLLPPDPYRFKEVRASSLWREAIGMMDPIMREKGIVQ